MTSKFFRGPFKILSQIFTKDFGEAAMAMEGWGKSELLALAQRVRRQLIPPRALQSWLNERSIDFVGIGATAAARSIASTAGWWKPLIREACRNGDWLRR